MSARSAASGRSANNTQRVALGLSFPLVAAVFASRKLVITGRRSHLNFDARPADDTGMTTEDELRGALILAGRRIVKLNFGWRATIQCWRSRGEC